jgi:hypothetical protein
MQRKAVFLLAALSLSQALYPQAFALLLPQKAASRAVKLLSAIDDLDSSLLAQTSVLSKAELACEDRTLAAFALLAASRMSKTAWASADGESRSPEAEAAYASARSDAKLAAKALSGTDADALALAQKLDEAEAALAALIIDSSPSGKSSLGIGKLLATGSRGASKLFPELAGLRESLSSASPEGARLSAAVLAYRDASAQGSYLLSSRAKIVALLPGIEPDLARLEMELAAYRAWLATFPAAAFPGDLGSASQDSRSSLGSAISSLAALGQARAAELLSAMSQAGPRDAAAARVASRLAAIWDGSPQPLRRELARLCGTSESALARFASAAEASAPPVRPSLPRSPSLDPLAALAALDGLAIAIADDEDREAAGEGNPSSSEPSLILLSSPGLDELARGETRFQGLYAEASRRIRSLYDQAAQAAQARLEASPAVAKAAAAALGSAPKGIVVKAVDLDPQAGEGRVVAFYATASDSSGQEVSFPIEAGTSAAEYAFAFAKAAGLGSSAGSSPRSLLAKYDQVLLSAYDPEGSRTTYVVDSFPEGRGPDRIDIVGIEKALMGGWQP